MCKLIRYFFALQGLQKSQKIAYLPNNQYFCTIKPNYSSLNKTIMPIKKVSIPRIDCGDNSGCLSEFVSIIVYMLFCTIGSAIVIFTLAGICCGVANLFN